VLADANPAIATLPTVTWRSLDQARQAGPPAALAGEPAASPGPPSASPGAPAASPGTPAAPPGAPSGQPVGWRSGRGQPPPNLGPPPEPPDWRKRHR
jgi:hypothetical protein